MSEKEGFNSLRGDQDFSKLRQLHYFSKLNRISAEQKINLLRLDRNAFLETFLEDAKLDSGKLLLQKIFWNEPTRENLLILTFYFFPYFFLSFPIHSFLFLFLLLFANLSYIQVCLKSNGQNDVWNFQTLRSDSSQKSPASFIQH